jgi:hypothetical protein
VRQSERVKNVRQEMHPSFWLENLIERDWFECPCVVAGIIASWILYMMGECEVDSSGPG